MTSPSIPERLDALRNQIRAEGVQAYLVPTADPHQSEYVPVWWRRRAWISGFTGSAGDVVVTLDDAQLWTDSRYYLQAEQQLAGSSIGLMRQGEPEVPSVATWLSEQLNRGGAVGFDPDVVSRDRFSEMASHLSRWDIDLRPLKNNLVDSVWKDRPARSQATVRILGEANSGEPVRDKLERVRQKMGGEGADVLIVSALDGVAWLMNLRGDDVNYNPVFVSHAVVTGESAYLYIDEDKLPEEARASLEPEVGVRPYGRVTEDVTDWARAGLKVWAPGDTTSHALCPEEILSSRSPITDFKAVKNPVEINGIRRAHVQDGVAVVSFIRWLERHVLDGGVTERDAAAQLLAFRREGEGFIGPSFETISAFGPHGAIVHYAVDETSDVTIGQDSLYLVDSGGQYRFGTTDITRTFCFGEPTPFQREMFTRVLKGHISLATASFPKGTYGKQLDIAARRPLWDVGCTYGHGTGHGIGHYLNVHEGPVSISPRGADVALSVGNVISNEPGYYEEGQWGIRIENLVTIVPDDSRSSEGQPFLKFETLTRCPIDRFMIDVGLLDAVERAWLDGFHKQVWDALAPHLDDEGKIWLKEGTSPISEEEA